VCASLSDYHDVYDHDEATPCGARTLPSGGQSQRRREHSADFGYRGSLLGSVLMTKFSLDARTAVVTGGSRGIGLGIAAALDQAGARVAIAGRDLESLENAASTLSNDPLVFQVDLTHADAPTRFAHEAWEALGGIDILVNNAAVASRTPTEELDAALIDRLYALNVRAPLLIISALVPRMRTRGKGTIINLSSVSGRVGTPRRAAYAATKGAIDAATRSLAIELGSHGIRVNAVAPGVVDTDLWAKNKDIPGVVEGIERQTPLGRWGRPDDIADAVVFLASDAARFITGETLAVDGGMGKTLDLYSGDV
jgi:NAD(P)-dependent dehydrogenase (short-subunit alcohol dehydrogenase family)